MKTLREILKEFRRKTVFKSPKGMTIYDIDHINQAEAEIRALQEKEQEKKCIMCKGYLHRRGK